MIAAIVRVTLLPNAYSCLRNIGTVNPPYYDNVAYGFLTVGGFLTVFLTACLFKLSSLYCRFKNQNIKTFNSLKGTPGNKGSNPKSSGRRQ